MAGWCDETADVYDERRVKARKVHHCVACGERVEPGHIYMRVAIIYDGGVTTLKRCLRCQAIHEHLRDVAPEPEAWPDEDLNCGHDYEEVHGGQPPPPEIAALAFKSGGDLQEAG